MTHPSQSGSIAWALSSPRLYFVHFTPVVNDSTKHLMEQRCPGDFDFQSTYYKYITKFDWHKWNLNHDEPKFYPKGGEPDDYGIGRRRISKNALAKMEATWELLVKPASVRFHHPEIDLSAMPDDFTPDEWWQIEQPLLKISDSAHTSILQSGFFTDNHCKFDVFVCGHTADWLRSNLAEWCYLKPVRHTFCSDFEQPLADDEPIHRLRELREKGDVWACSWMPEERF